ncbi:MAG: tetratricopeptide repeat protein [Deltaproteobacteria bacterium]|nr:tetratricopeptide repeat protein [Deltaproteobacteria bacterium]
MPSLFKIFRPSRRMSDCSSAESGSPLGHEASFRDTRAAIDQLSQVVRNNPDAVEIYLALGNLFRSQGDLERAIQIRNTLIVRSGLDERFKAKAWLELGRDYKRAGFLDRAQQALDEARKTLRDDPAILAELLRLSATAGDFSNAAEYASLLEDRIAQAHYLVRQAMVHGEADQTALRAKLLKRALQIYPGSVEAWIEGLKDAYARSDWRETAKQMSRATASVAPGLRFVLFESLLGFAAQGAEDGPPMRPECTARLLPVIEGLSQDLLLYYYGSLLLIHGQDYEQARSWLEKTLILHPDFWPARLELLLLSAELQELSAAFKVQLEFFLEKARMVKKFVCSSCGLKREAVFFHCPRCEAWHSITFRLALND